MPTYDSIISRVTPPGTDPLVPEPLSNSIIQELPTHSAVLQHARRIPMATRTQRMPVLDTLPQAYWVNGDSGLKETTSQEWGNVHLVVEELAALVPVPDAYIDDANIPIWDEVRPRLVEALAQKIDAACLFGVNKPSTWSPAIVTAALAAGNTVAANNQDIPLSVAELAEKVSLDGFTNINGWLSRPGFAWRLLRVRSDGSGEPIYSPDLQNSRGGNLYGYPMTEVRNGAWDPSVADLLVGDWSKAIIGMRQDITFSMSSEAVIADDDGKVIYSAFQQDGKIMRVVMRLAFATANPVTVLNQNASTRYPFGVLTHGTASS